MVAEDPKEMIGSGGATLNALLSVTEFLSGLSGNTVATAEALANTRILVMHLVITSIFIVLTD